jgi:hypothetical protein
MEGYKSRKFVLVLIGCLLITVGWFSLQWLRFLEATYLHYTAGIMGLVALYFGVNAVHKQVTLKAQMQTTESTVGSPPNQVNVKTEKPAEEINNGE